MTAATIAEICIAACADTYRESGEVLAHAVGIIPALGARRRAHFSARDVAHRFSSRQTRTASW
jgi:hypothetical protein